MIAQAFNIRILSDTASPAVRRTLAGIQNSKALARYMGRAVQHEIAEYAATTDQARHATAFGLGAQPTGFLQDAYALATQPDAIEASPNQVILKLPRAAFARAFGDVNILPANKYLTIPACAEAYGRRAGTFNNLTFGYAYDAKLGIWRKALVEAKATKVSFGRARKDGTRQVKAFSSSTGLTAIYWLVAGVHQKQDRSLLPSDEAIVAAAREGAQDYIEIVIEHLGGDN